ncbi:MAG TPA: helix-turn-helix domain-containing protein [Candidatus Anaerostipes excrementavium]|uniref:Helix-turn-helix domain-containing protein n=1 Tax=Candidatus Anaerostipes excrementavium TaxID=2838463 RepID=A0A9D2B8B9_9FIRM|nr:helix-turn-helix transcriptional regulator [uncultured Anaerostipes sp.]HIX66688.1 helix-turn-helix domain-containing protein [Candidatus Anaerostipes excrementavium]
MDFLNFSKNLIRLRQERNLTQEQLANFIGVTKASVSKWENKQSLPDLMILPKLSALFDISIDELLGYNAQLSKEESRKIYHDLADDFANQPFDVVLEKSQKLVKQYYSCYRFLFQIAALWTNHFMLADIDSKQKKVLTDAVDLCSHIVENSKDMGLRNDALSLKSYLYLFLGTPKKTIEILEELQNPYSLGSQSDAVLIDAYCNMGELDKANSFSQIRMFTYLLNFMSISTKYLSLHLKDVSICEETIARMEELIRIYHLDELHPSSVISFKIQCAVFYALHEKKREALQMLDQYVRYMKLLLKDDQNLLHGDAYFTALEPWFESADLGSAAPRNKKVIFESGMSIFHNPLLQSLETEPKYQELKKIMSFIGGNL